MNYLTRSRGNNQLVPYQQQQSVIFCQFCQQLYYSHHFARHLNYCQNYILYARKTIAWKPKPKRRRTIPIRTLPDPFPHLVKGKRVIIVGPSASVQRCSLGRFIDSFDIVVRLNKSLPIPSRMREHIGSRTDILYNSLNTWDYPGQNNISVHFLRRQGIRYLRCPYPPIPPFKRDIRLFQKKNRNAIPFGFIDTQYYRRLRQRLGTRPYTGMCAIADLLREGVDELYVMGLDFYTYGYADYYRTLSQSKIRKLRNNRIHQRKPQLKLMRRFYLLDERVVTDTILDKILLDSYDHFFLTIREKVDFNRCFITGKKRFLSNKNKLFQIAQTQNQKICLLGDSFSTPLLDFSSFDKVIYLSHQNNLGIIKKADLLILPEWKPLRKTFSEKEILIPTAFHNEKKFPKKDNLLFLNSLFSKYLKALLSQFSIKEGLLSSELFVILLFAIFLGQKNKLYIQGMKPIIPWNEQPRHLQEHHIQQRMLYQFMIKRQWLYEC